MKHLLILAILVSTLALFSCQETDDKAPEPEPEPATDLITMTVEGDPFRSTNQYAIYDSILDYSEVSGRDGDYTLLLRKNGRFTLGQYQLGDEGLLGYVQTPSAGEFQFTALTLTITSVADDSLEATFSGTVAQQGAPDLSITDGEVDKLWIRRQGNTTNAYTDSTNFTMEIDGIGWSAIFSVGAFRDTPNRMTLEATGQNALTGARATVAFVLPIAEGETGTYALDAVPGLGGSYVVEGAPFIFDQGVIAITAHDSSYLSGELLDMRAERISGNSEDYRNISSGEFKEIPIFR